MRGETRSAVAALAPETEGECRFDGSYCGKDGRIGGAGEEVQCGADGSIAELVCGGLQRLLRAACRLAELLEPPREGIDAARQLLDAVRDLCRQLDLARRDGSSMVVVASRPGEGGDR